MLAPEAGASVSAALEAETDRQFQQARTEGRFEPADAYRADAVVALLTGRGTLARGGRKQRTTRGGCTCDPKATVSVVVDAERPAPGLGGRGGAL